MSNLVPNPHVYPPDGYFFLDKNKVKHVGKNYADLVARIRDYRLRNGRPLGDVVEEVNAFTCARFPPGCRDTSSPPPGAITPGAQLAARVTQWYYALIRVLSETPVLLVPPELAQERANICLKCPRQANWATACGSCAGSTFRLGVSIRQGSEVKKGDQLRGCDLLGEDTRTSIWLPRLLPSTLPTLPDFCWRKNP